MRVWPMIIYISQYLLKIRWRGIRVCVWAMIVYISQYLLEIWWRWIWVRVCCNDMFELLAQSLCGNQAFLCYSGCSLLRDPRYNKGLAFTEGERDAHYLRGPLPPAIFHQELQVTYCPAQLLNYIRTKHKLKFYSVYSVFL